MTCCFKCGLICRMLLFRRLKGNKEKLPGSIVKKESMSPENRSLCGTGRALSYKDVYSDLDLYFQDITGTSALPS